MATKLGSEGASQSPKPADQKPTDGEKPAKSWGIPVITGLALAFAFCAYYFVYVGARRQYLANRNFRALALLGEQLQQRISVHGNILEFCASLAAQRQTSHRQKEDLAQFLIVRPEDEKLKKRDKEREALRDYLKYLAPTFDVTEIPHRSSEPVSRLHVERHSDRWELILTASAGTDKDYQGSLKIDELLAPLAGLVPFDDILLVSNEGTIVYQSKRTGPQFTALSNLLRAQIGGAESQPAGKSGSEPEGREPSSESASRSQPEKQNSPITQNADPEWRKKSLHLTEVKLAGVRYKLFLQPILVSSFRFAETRAEPASEWVLCGLRSSAALEWEALSLSFTFFIWFTIAFFVIWTSYKALKIFFMNHCERLRLRELGALGLSLVLLASVITFSLLQLDFRLNDDTDARLKELGSRLSKNIHQELGLMRNQLKTWCSSKELNEDLTRVDKKNAEIIRNTAPKGSPLTGRRTNQTPEPESYPYLTNAFWTDDDGHQIVKWSTTQYVTPMIDISQLSVYAYPATHLLGDNTAFHFGSILPPNKLEYLATLNMRTSACANHTLGVRDDIADGYAFLTAQPLSLLDPILPYGYGLALVDQSGSVLFHSDKTRNGRENFLVESDENKELRAAIFGRSSTEPLPLKYMGKDCRALVVPVEKVSQAPWSLIVYRDLTSVRTLNLQVMAVASTLLFLVLAGPVGILAIWCVIRRPRFAPEWLWPNPRRTETYVCQIGLYTLLIILFSCVLFWGSAEQIVTASWAVPVIALSMTWWCFRIPPWAAGKPRPEERGRVRAASAAAAVLLGLFVQFARLKRPRSLFGCGVEAAVPLLARPRHYLISTLERWRAADALAEKSPGSLQRPLLNYKNCYLASVLLLLLLIGVLTPMGLFRASLNVERRLAIKQAQLHLASAVAQRWKLIIEQYENEQLSEAAWRVFQENIGSKTPANPWPWIVPLGLPQDSKPPDLHPAHARELYSGWFRRLIYSLHHDYNESSAEMLGVLEDHGNPPDWFWENQESNLTLRWHGAHPESPAHNDLLFASTIPASGWSDAVTYMGIVATVMLVIGRLVWALARRVFLLDVAPLKMTGARQVAESLREGKNVLILLPPVSHWRLDALKWTVDVAEMATSPKWAEALDLAAIPSNIVIEILHFEFCANDPEIDNQKFILLERLLKRANTQLAVIMTVPVSSEDYRRTFPDLEVIDLREEPFPWLKQYEGPAQQLIWKECSPMAALWPLGAQLAKDLKAETVHSEDTIASEILERADPYYRLIWNECTREQKFVLSQLAEDGVLNPTNGRAIRQLVRRGLIVKDPQFRIMNESFRRFLRSSTTAELKQKWLQESRRSGWGRAHGAFFTTMTLLGVFLLATQNTLWQSAAAYVTTALGAFGTVAKLFDTLRGHGTPEKAS